MNSSKMIMGEPPDSEIESKKIYIYLRNFFLILLSITICYFIFRTLKNSKPTDVISNSSGGKIQLYAKKGVNNKNNWTENGDTYKSESLIQTNPDAPKKVEKNIFNPAGSGQKTFVEKNEMKKFQPKSSSNNISKTQCDDKSAYQNTKTVLSSPARLYFNFKNHTLTPESVRIIKDIFKAIATRSGRLIIEGHTCSIGSEKSNTALSEKRAKSVANIFRELGLGTNIRMSLFAFGESNPVSVNQTSEGRVENRRVVIRFVPDKIITRKNASTSIPPFNKVSE